MATSGPGATNLVTGLANAMMDSSAIVAITGQVSSHLVGSDAYNKALGLRRAKAAVAYLSSLGIGTARLEAVASFGKTQPIIQTSGPEERNRRTVTEVSGFVQNNPAVLNGKYAAIIMKEYVKSAKPRHPQNTVIVTEVDPAAAQ